MLSAELRSHEAGDIGGFTPKNAEITQILRGTGSIISRGSGLVRQKFPAEPGIISITPAGIREEATTLFEDVPEVLHIYLPPHSFLSPIDAGLPDFRAQDLCYQAGVVTPAIHEMTLEIARELYQETSSGGLRADSVAVSLIAILAARHSETSSSRSSTALAKGLLDRRRLDRVLRFIEANLEAEINVNDLAEVACFSLFHFVRAFHLAMGRPPHTYVSERRLDRAKHLLAYSDTSLVDISLTCRFSGQGNFTKAFKRATGVSPGGYRKAVRK